MQFLCTKPAITHRIFDDIDNDSTVNQINQLNMKSVHVLCFLIVCKFISTSEEVTFRLDVWINVIY